MKFVFHKPYRAANEDELAVLPAELTRNKNVIYKADRSAIGALKSLLGSARKDGVTIVVISAYRGYEKQKELFIDAEKRHGKGKGILWLAPPGYSEHHTGYVFDLADESRPESDDEESFRDTPSFQWLSKNAGDFGFELSFPENNWQGVGYEPWHWRFAGGEKSMGIFHPGVLKSAKNLIKSVCNGIYRRLIV